MPTSQPTSQPSSRPTAQTSVTNRAVKTNPAVNLDVLTSLMMILVGYIR
jgi:hypothetical protein